MAYDDLRDFIARLEKDGQLRRVTAPVDPTLEVTEIVRRVVRARGPALLFERPTRGRLPLAINLFGTEHRMATALGVQRLDDIGAGGAFIRSVSPPQPGTPLVLEVLPPGAAVPLSIEGRVAWARQDPGAEGFGVEFRCRDTGGLRRLKELVRRLEGGSVAAPN